MPAKALLHPIQLQSEMKLRGLTLQRLKAVTGLPYTKISEVLNERRVCVRTLRTIQAAILRSPRRIHPQPITH